MYPPGNIWQMKDNRKPSTKKKHNPIILVVTGIIGGIDPTYSWGTFLLTWLQTKITLDFRKKKAPPIFMLVAVVAVVARNLAYKLSLIGFC